MALTHNLKFRNGFCLIPCLGLAMLCEFAAAQGLQRYPLQSRVPHAQPVQPRLQIAEPGNPAPAIIEFQPLPKLESAQIQQQSFDSELNSTGEAKNAFSDGFESAYANLNIQADLPLNFDALSAIADDSEFSPPPPIARFANQNGEPQYSGMPSNGSFSETAIDQGANLAMGNTDSLVWWKNQVLNPIHSPGSKQSVDTNSLVYRALQNSPRILALSQNPLIRELQVIEADSEFDPTSFVRSQFQDRVDPVGDSLSTTVDLSGFLQDHIWTGEFGVRQKLRTGATVDLSQTLGFRNSNSSFFTPQDQGTATLALNVTQPLLRGRGRYINRSQILIAQSAGGAAWNTFSGELQDEIQRTVTSYWQLYFDRSVYLQKQRNVERGEKILRTLEGRKDLDSLPSQIARARSAVQSRKTDLANALRDIRNSETEIRRLTADRDWKSNQGVEILPVEIPSTDGLDIDLEQVVVTALEHRPEIKETLTRAKIAVIQRDVSLNELLPELSLLLGTYVSALQGESRLGQAIVDQFGDVKPGYSVGVEFELPIRNRAARSRLAQRKAQVTRIRAEVDESIQNVVAESQISLRRITSAKQTLDAAAQAIEAAAIDREQNFRRWESFALIEGDIADGQTPTTVLDQLLDSQERLTAAELVYTQAELELKTAEVALQRTMGTLLIHENISFGKSYDGDNPQLHIDKAQSESAVTHQHPLNQY